MNWTFYKNHSSEPCSPDPLKERLMEPKIKATQTELAAAFTEWDRRWREEPGRFKSESQVLAGTSKSYGASCAPYLIEILSEQQLTPPPGGPC